MSDLPHCPHQAVCAAQPARFEAVATFSGLAALRALSLSQRAVGLATLSRHAMGADTGAALHARLTEMGVESLVLTTCNRTELYWRARLPGDDETVTRAFADATGDREHWVLVSGPAAAHHLFRVCAGLESLVLGEAEILGQVRAALEACAGAGSFLQGVAQAALRAGRMARAETAIGVGALSVASAGVQVIARALPLAASRVLIVGAGATGVKAGRHLRKLGVGELIVANRTQSRADQVAASFDARSIAMDQLPGTLATVDAAIIAVHGDRPLLGLDTLRAVTAQREQPLVLVDLSMPAAVAAGEVAGLTHVTLAGLQREVERQRDRRATEIPKVEAVLDREMRHLQSWARHQAMRPLVSDLRRKVEEIRRTELARAQNELPDALPTDVAVLDRLSRRLLEQVLAIPLAAMASGEAPLDASQARYLRRLFALGPEA
ncbi:glutamyl-tRNA reductase [Luteitalea sp.]|uniref:glutamyl-tRNA reductase n=1 Tax=Luteitalea sp. TaxID=2004800 RepID=UPI0025BC0752|nr:glutamyl-tRNA reductase [Luteitalea sp.]